MPRQARLDALGSLHHVMIRGIERKSIFLDNEDRKDFVVRLGNLAKETGIREKRTVFLSERNSLVPIVS